MLIVNKHGIMRDIPDESYMPPQGRKATKAEIAYFKKTGDQVAANTPKPRRAKPKAAK